MLGLATSAEMDAINDRVTALHLILTNYDREAGAAIRKLADELSATLADLRTRMTGVERRLLMLEAEHAKW